MNSSPIGFAPYALVLALAPIGASADTIFKCAGDDGKIIYQSTKCETGQQLVIKQTTEATSVSGPSAPFIINNNSNGGFFTIGFINGSPINMSLITGYKEVVLPLEFAQRIGVKCESSEITTNSRGDVHSCKSRVSTMKIGSITLTNVEVSILPVINTVLVGQAALGLLKVEQTDKQMRLSVINGETR